MQEKVDPLIPLLSMPPGTAIFSRVDVGQGWQTDFLIHEDEKHLRQLPRDLRIQIRTGLIVEGDIHLVNVMFIAGSSLDFLYETWWNWCGDLGQCFRDMVTQATINFHFHTEMGMPKRSVQIPNSLKGAFEEYCLRLDGRSWEMKAFDAAREKVYRRFPKPEDLWRSFPKPGK